MGKTIGYGKLGRSMPLTLAKCGNLGGDVEMVAVVKELALRHPDDTFILIGRNSGELPSDVGLPPNIVNPWHNDSSYNWAQPVRDFNKTLHYVNGDLPDVREKVILTRFYEDLTGPTFDKLDGIVMWVGQHGTSNSPIPQVADNRLITRPQIAFVHYCAFMLNGINRWRDADPWNREEVNLNADARNRHKMRDLKWPLRHPVLAQFSATKPIKHHRYGDTRSPHDVSTGQYTDWAEYAKQIGPETWYSTCVDTYARLEINGLYPGTPFGDLISFNDDFERPGNFGLFINEARSIGIRPQLMRANILHEWVLPLNPHFIHGTWSKESQAKLNREIYPAAWDQYYPKLHSVLTTFTTPSSGSGWATAKPWEAFAAGTVCFFHPEYDTQNNILADADPTLRDWLRVKNSDELRARVRHLSTQSGRTDWLWLVTAQRMHFDKALMEREYMNLIEKRLYP